MSKVTLLKQSTYARGVFCRCKHDVKEGIRETILHWTSLMDKNVQDLRQAFSIGEDTKCNPFGVSNEEGILRAIIFLETQVKYVGEQAKSSLQSYAHPRDEQTPQCEYPLLARCVINPCSSLQTLIFPQATN